ncbi:MAG: ribosome small subunit-dependent GTPase A [Clostridia bacterium]
MQGLIIENKANLYKIKIEENGNSKFYTATARGKFKNDNFTPVVGDIAEISILDEEKSTAVIENIQERKTYIKRPKMANITQIIFVVSSKHPKPDLLLLDKQLAFAEFLKIKPIIVLNKIDLDDKQEFIKISNIYTSIGYKVLQTNAKTGTGIAELLEKLENNISAFSGNSGVGKSTLINDIFKDRITEEGEISAKNKKGKNTTTDIKLYELNKNTYIADTPGFSTFDVYEIPYKELEKYFIEFKEGTKMCKYVGCSHIKEKECGVKEKLENNKISTSRYENYTKIYNELKDKEDHKW